MTASPGVVAVIVLLAILLPLSTGFFPGWKPPVPKQTTSKDRKIPNLVPLLPLDLFSRESFVLTPHKRRKHSCDNEHIAIILVPGCMIQPRQYAALARSIQEHASNSGIAVWIHVPKQVQDFANPLTVGLSVRMAWKDLQLRGYPGRSAFVGGHSLGGAFLSSVLEEDDPIMTVDGLLHLGCIVPRDASEHYANIPCLTVCGDLDGLVRSSRIAEDYYRNVESAGNTIADQLHHSIVVVEGMNHFGIVEGDVTFMDNFRDLEAEISREQSILKVASAVAEFAAFHQQGSTTAATSLISKINATYDFIEPLIEAMHLEGSYHIDTPCHLCTESDDPGCSESCIQGSPWAAKVQREISPEGDYGDIQDEFHQSWWINPLADPPFYHPSIDKVDGNKLDMETVSEPVYEKPDYYLFDAGFFSNTALEIRSKFNSPQSILKARGDDARYEANDNTCSKMNERTIQWALESAPERVRRRYQRRGVKLATGRDIEHNSVVIDSHTMSTPLDHPVPFSGGKLYCKLLSPAKALDWMYTDSLRPSTELGKVVNEGLLSPMKLAERLEEGSRLIPFLPFSLLSTLSLKNLNSRGRTGDFR